MALLPGHQHGRQPQQTPSHPTPAASFSPTPDANALGYPIDPSAAAKQMAALNAVGMARMAQTGRGPSASSSSGGPTSAGLLGGMASLNQQHSPPSVTGHDPFSPQGRSFQAHTPGLSNSLPPNLNVNPQAGINVPPTDPVLVMAAQMASSNPSPQMLQTFNNKKRQFLAGLASIHASRNSPLPPTLTGVPTPGFDPNNTPWKMIEPSTTEIGCIRLAGREVDLFKLWTMVYRAGGCPKVSQQHAWSSLLAPFELPETFPIPQANMPNSVAEVLGAIYTRIVFPFEQMYNRGSNNRDSQQQQQRALAAARAQAGQFPQSGSSGLSAPMSGGEMGMQAMMAAAMSHSGGSGPIMPANAATPIPPMLSRQPSSNSVMSPQQSLGSMTPADGLPGMNSGSGSNLSGLPMGPVGPQVPVRDDILPLDGDIDIRKRKFGMEDDTKRVRQKTSEPPDASLSNVDRASSSAPPGSVPPAQTPGSVSQSQITPQGRAPQGKVYKPIVREIDTSGGRDLRLLAEEYHRAANRRATRDVNEWGNIDIDLLAMSIRSRISTELSYALTTLTVLSIMRGPNGTGFPIHNCDELMEELLDLLEEVAFGTDEAKHWEDETTIVTHKHLVSKIVEDGSRPFASLDRRQGQKPMELGPTQRPGDIILAVFNIIRNLSVLAENQEFLAKHDRVLGVILLLCALRRKDGELLPASPALSLADLVAIRRDALYLLVNLAPAVQLAPSQAAAASPSTTSMDLARRSFELVSSYIVDPSETVTPVVLIVQSDVVPSGNIKPPALVDAALEVFTRIAQPDSNRQVISKAVPHAWQRQLFEALVHRLPLTDHDFQITMKEMWLSYVEKIVMSIYALAFLAPPALKQELKQDRRLGFSKVMLRLVKKLMINVPGDIRTFFHVSAKRATEAMKVLDDGEDSFDTSKSTNGPPLSFGVGYGEVGEDRVERGTGMLGGFQEDVVWGVMMQKEVDDSMFRELESLARVGYV